MTPKKIAVVVGTRPNFIKITQLEKELNKHPNSFEFILIHTGQHSDTKMSEVFFNQLKLKEPNYNLGIQAESREEKTELMIRGIGDVLKTEKPDLVIVVGDVDSTFAGARAAKENNIKLAHLESGLRSFDLTMPEEINRIAVDKISNFFFVTEESGIKNLINEGVEERKIHFVGNTMIDTLVHFDEEIHNHSIVKDLGLANQEYILMTMHRPRNVDIEENLRLILELIKKITEQHPVILPIHPRTKQKIDSFGLSSYIEGNKNLHILDPLDYFAFQNLILNAKVVITDSGGIQEETTFRKVACLTVRENTERPSTLELGTNKLVPLDVNFILNKVDDIYKIDVQKSEIPPLWDGKATNRIVRKLNDIL